MVAHHDHIKPCVLFAREMIIHWPVSEDTAMHLVPGGPTPQGDRSDQNHNPASHPAHLRQSI